MKRACLIFLFLFLCLISAPAARPAQAQSTETVLYNFTGGTDGGTPQSSLTLRGGNFYGTTQFGGTGLGQGTVFVVSPNGSGGWNETVINNFCPESGACPNGSYPNGPVIFDSVGNLYGITPEGGNTNCSAVGCGVAFELSPVGADWTETVLYVFCSPFTGVCQGGNDPGGGVVMDAAGNLYGQVAPGAFELSPSSGGWTEKLISFNVENSKSGLTMDATGNIFGMAFGVTGLVAFELSPNGKGGWNTTVLYTFTTNPNPTIWSSLALDQAGNLYGTETGWYIGPGNGEDEFFGTAYKLSPGETGWTKTVIYTFSPDDSALEGNGPSGGGLVLDSAGNIYGTTMQGGTYGQGTVFELVAPVGMGSYEEKVLWSFDGTDGSKPNGGLILDSAGNLYGTTPTGGSSGAGIAFEISGILFDATATTLTLSLGQSSYGEAVTLNAVVSSNAGPPPDGETVTFMQGKTILATGVLSGGSASFTTSALSMGSKSITAVYGGDSKFFSSTSSAKYQDVYRAATTTTLTSSLSSSIFGQSVTFTATVAPEFSGIPTGTVTFQNGAVTLGTVTLSGGVANYSVSKLAVGTASITAVYSGSVSFFASSSGALSQVVNQATTTTTLTSSLNPSIFGQPVTFTATVAPEFIGTPGGTVTFKNGAATLGTVALSVGVAKYTTKLAVGTASIIAVYNGGISFITSSSEALSQVVSQATTTTTLTSSLNPSIFGQSVAFTATVAPEFSGTPGGTVTFTDETGTLAKVTLGGGVAKYTAKLPVGTASITAVYNGGSSFTTSSSEALSQVVNQATTTTTLTSSLNPSNAGQSVTFTATVAPEFSVTPGGTVTFYNGATLLKAVTLSGGVAKFTTSALPSGADSITAVYAGNANFGGSSSAPLIETVN
jgi:hypothetical protein